MKILFLFYKLGAMFKCKSEGMTMRDHKMAWFIFAKILRGPYHRKDCYLKELAKNFQLGFYQMQCPEYLRVGFIEKYKGEKNDK